MRSIALKGRRADGHEHHHEHHHTHEHRHHHASLPLAMAGRGDSVRVFSIRGRDDTRRYLESLGFVEGCEVSVVNQMGGNLIIEVKGARVALDRQMAMRVMVA